MIADTATSITFNFTLNNYGHVYGIAVKRIENASTSIPSSYQIWRGFDSVNAEAVNATVEVLQPNIGYELTFNLLKASTTYDIYITAGNNHPIYPDLLGGGATVSIEASTRDSNVGDGEARATIYGICVTVILIIAVCL